MDHTLGEDKIADMLELVLVLILVLVDHTLGDFIQGLLLMTAGGLNPCFSGPYSRSAKFLKTYISIDYNAIYTIFNFSTLKKCTFTAAKIQNMQLIRNNLFS